MPVGNGEAAQLVRLHSVPFAVLEVGERLRFAEIGFEILLFMPVDKAPPCADKTSGREPQGKEDVHGDDSGNEDDAPSS